MSGVRLFTLMYHDVVDPPFLDDSGFSGAGPAHYKVGTLLWETHVRALDRAGTPPARFDTAEEGSWLLTFDDGGASALAVGRALADRGWVGHFFVTGAYVGERAFLDARGIRELHRLGHVVGAHSFSHPERMSSLPPTECVREWLLCRERLEGVIGAPVRSASLPGGYFGPQVAAAAAEAGLTHLFTSEPTARTSTVGGCTTIGRFAITRSTTAEDVAALAAGRLGPRMWRAASWTTKRGVKRMTGPLYPAMRRAILSKT